MLASVYVAKAKNEGGFDVPDADVLGWLNERHRELVSKAQSLRAEKVLGATVAGQSDYPVEARVVDVRKVLIGSAPWGRASQEDIFDVRAGRARLSGEGGVFAPYYSDDGLANGIRLFPTPESSGASILGLCALMPVDLVIPSVSGSDSAPVIPDDFEDELLSGTIATGLLRIDERPDLAGVFETKFQGAIEGLRRRVNSRVGGGPVQAQIKGIHF